MDQYIKHNLKVKHYIRYVDYFVIFSTNLQELNLIQEKINRFLKKLRLELHPLKTKIISLNQGIPFLGVKIFFYNKILLKKNKKKFQRKYLQLKNSSTSFDPVYDFMEGWMAHSGNFNSFNLEQNLLTQFQKEYSNKVSTKEINRIIKNL